MRTSKNKRKLTSVSVKKLFCINILMPLLVILTAASIVTCRASDIYENRTDDMLDAQADVLETDSLRQALPDDARDILKDYSINRGTSLDSGLKSILERGSRQAGGIVKSGIRSAVLLLLIVLCCGIAKSLFEAGSSAVPDYVAMAGALALSASVAADIYNLIGLGKKMLESLDTFSKALLGTLAAASSVLGQPASTAAKYMATVLFMDVLITAINRVILPVLYAYIAVSTANAALGDNMLGKLSAFLNWVCVSILGLILTAFTAYLSITGIIAGSTDAVALKATKMVLSNAIPVVGKILSDASETVLAGTRILRNSIGIFGMVGVLAICVIPFLQLAVQYLLFKLVAVTSSVFSEGRLSSLIDSLAGAFGIILGMLGSCVIIIIISIVSVISAIG